MSTESPLRVVRSNSASQVTHREPDESVLDALAASSDDQGVILIPVLPLDEVAKDLPDGDERKSDEEEELSDEEKAEEDALLAKAGSNVKLIRGGAETGRGSGFLPASMPSLSNRKEPLAVKDAGSITSLTEEEQAEHLRQRGLALHEIVSTEKDYVKDLEMLVKVCAPG